MCTQFTHCKFRLVHDNVGVEHERVHFKIYYVITMRAKTSQKGPSPSKKKLGSNCSV